MAANFLKQILLFVFTPHCYDEFFTKMNFTDVDCLKATLSKCLGIGLIAGSVLVKVPQILKITKAGSAEGISFTSTLLELVAIIASFSYNFVNGYPFSSWGDNAFLLLQTALIGALVLHYNGSSQQALLFLATITGTVAVLCSGNVPMQILLALQASNIPIVFIAKMLQAWSNYSAGSTGQLSAVTVTLLTAGSAARIFTSIQETGDRVIIATYCVATFANSVLFGQLLWYWSAAPHQAKAKQRAAKKRN